MMSAMSRGAISLQTFQGRVARALLLLALFNIPSMGSIAFGLKKDAVAAVAATALLAIVPILAFLTRRSIRVLSLTLAIGLIGQVSVLVALYEGHPWQVEMHFCYFAMLAVLSGFCDWRVVVTGAIAIAVYHLCMNELLPALLYPGGGDVNRVVVHAVIVGMETGMLVVINIAISGAFARAEEARNTVEALAEDLRRAGLVREEALVTTTGRANHLAVLLERFQSDMLERLDVLGGAAALLGREAAQLGEAATRTNGQSAAVSKAAEATNERVTSMAATGQQFAVTIAEIGRNADQSCAFAEEAVLQAAATTRTIDDLSLLSVEIGEIISTIAAIASQTNLLALNATIEAARAGDQGRGFAIVAQEVKILSVQTAEAARSVDTQIATIKAATTRSIAAIGTIAAHVEGLKDFAIAIARAVDEQTQAAREIASGVDAAAGSVAHVSGAITEIEAVADTTAKAARSLSAAACQIADQTVSMRAGVLAFTADLKVA